MQNPIHKFSQSSNIFKKTGFLSEKLKPLTSSNHHEVYFFCRNLVHISYLTISTKACSNIFKFCLDLGLLIKM